MNQKLKEYIKLKNSDNLISLFYLGQEGIILNLNKLTFCVDPYLSDYVDKNCSNKIIKWKRLYKPSIKGNDLKFVDYFLFTHTHYDHCDPWTIKDILKVNKKAKFIIGVNNVKYLIKYGINKTRIIPIRVNKPLFINVITINSYPAKHDMFHKHNNDYDELCFSFTFKDFKIFHAGDTLDYPNLVKNLNKSNIALLPINGRDRFRTKNDVIGNLSPLEAFRLIDKSNSKLLIPIHNDLYAINSSSDLEIKRAINKFKRVKYIMLKHNNYLKVDLNK